MHRHMTSSSLLTLLSFKIQVKGQLPYESTRMQLVCEITNDATNNSTFNDTKIQLLSIDHNTGKEKGMDFDQILSAS